MRKWLENLKKNTGQRNKLLKISRVQSMYISQWEAERFLETSDIGSSWNSTFSVKSKVRIIFNEVQIITFKFGSVCVSSRHVNG